MAQKPYAVSCTFRILVHLIWQELKLIPTAKINIKIVCDKNGYITSMEYLTAKELEDFFGDIGN